MNRLIKIRTCFLFGATLLTKDIVPRDAFAQPIMVTTNQLFEEENTSLVANSFEKLTKAYLGKQPFIMFYIVESTKQFSIPLENAVTVVQKNLSSNVQAREHSQDNTKSFIWSSLFHSNVKEPQVVAVDRAGFIRFNQKLNPQITDISKEIEQASKVLSRPEFERIQVGLPAPDFTLADMNGRKLRLSELEGKKNLLLTFFPKCFTGGCATHLSSLRDQWPALQKQDTEVWGVSVDPATGAKGQLAFAKQLGLPFPMIPDTGRNLSLLFGAVNTPTQVAARMSVLIDKKGMVRWVDKQIDIPTHGSDVLAKIREL